MRLITDIGKLWFNQTRKRAVLEQILLYAKLNHQQLIKVNTNMADANERLSAVEKNLDEASTEILAEIAKLKGETLSEEGQATLTRLETKAQALANVADPIEAPPADEPPPNTVPDGPTETTEG